MPTRERTHSSPSTIFIATSASSPRSSTSTDNPLRPSRTEPLEPNSLAAYTCEMRAWGNVAPSSASRAAGTASPPSVICARSGVPGRRRCAARPAGIASRSASRWRGRPRARASPPALPAAVAVTGATSVAPAAIRASGSAVRRTGAGRRRAASAGRARAWTRVVARSTRFQSWRTPRGAPVVPVVRTSSGRAAGGSAGAARGSPLQRARRRAPRSRGPSAGARCVTTTAWSNRSASSCDFVRHRRSAGTGTPRRRRAPPRASSGDDGGRVVVEDGEAGDAALEQPGGDAPRPASSARRSCR